LFAFVWLVVLVELRRWLAFAVGCVTANCLEKWVCNSVTNTRENVALRSSGAADNMSLYTAPCHFGTLRQRPTLWLLILYESMFVLCRTWLVDEHTPVPTTQGTHSRPDAPKCSQCPHASDFQR